MDFLDGLDDIQAAAEYNDGGCSNFWVPDDQWDIPNAPKQVTSAQELTQARKKTNAFLKEAAGLGTKADRLEQIFRRPGL